MGLDMYAGKTNRDIPPVDFEEMEGDESLHVWRKHPNLHGWMERLYREKGGKAESFDCVPVRLTLEDLAVLESDIKTGALPRRQASSLGDPTALRSRTISSSSQTPERPSPPV